MGASTAPVTVFWQSSNGTAANALDFSTGSGTLTFPAGTTARTFTVWVHGDRTREATEYFWVHLSSPSHVTLGHTWAKGTIVNDD
jgi:Calx-beta domain